MASAAACLCSLLETISSARWLGWTAMTSSVISTEHCGAMHVICPRCRRDSVIYRHRNWTVINFSSSSISQGDPKTSHFSLHSLSLPFPSLPFSLPLVSFHLITSSSAIAERPRCRVGQFWPKVEDCTQYRSIFNHCDLIGLQSYRIRWNKTK